MFWNMKYTQKGFHCNLQWDPLSTLPALTNKQTSVLQTPFHCISEIQVENGEVELVFILKLRKKKHSLFIANASTSYCPRVTFWRGTCQKNKILKRHLHGSDFPSFIRKKIWKMLIHLRRHRLLPFLFPWSRCLIWLGAFPNATFAWSISTFCLRYPGRKAELVRGLWKIHACLLATLVRLVAFLFWAEICWVYAPSMLIYISQFDLGNCFKEFGGFFKEIPLVLSHTWINDGIRN